MNIESQGKGCGISVIFGINKYTPMEQLTIANGYACGRGTGNGFGYGDGDGSGSGYGLGRGKGEGGGDGLGSSIEEYFED